MPRITLTHNHFPRPVSTPLDTTSPQTMGRSLFLVGATRNPFPASNFLPLPNEFSSTQLQSHLRRHGRTDRTPHPTTHRHPPYHRSVQLCRPDPGSLLFLLRKPRPRVGRHSSSHHHRVWKGHRWYQRDVCLENVGMDVLSCKGNVPNNHPTF